MTPAEGGEESASKAQGAVISRKRESKVCTSLFQSWHWLELTPICRRSRRRKRVEQDDDDDDDNDDDDDDDEDEENEKSKASEDEMDVDERADEGNGRTGTASPEREERLGRGARTRAMVSVLR